MTTGEYLIFASSMLSNLITIWAFAKENKKLKSIRDKVFEVD